MSQFWGKKIYIYAKYALTSGTKHSLWVQFPFERCAQNNINKKSRCMWKEMQPAVLYFDLEFQ